MCHTHRHSGSLKSETLPAREVARTREVESNSSLELLEAPRPVKKLEVPLARKVVENTEPSRHQLKHQPPRLDDEILSMPPRPKVDYIKANAKGEAPRTRPAQQVEKAKAEPIPAKSQRQPLSIQLRVEYVLERAVKEQGNYGGQQSKQRERLAEWQRKTAADLHSAIYGNRPNGRQLYQGFDILINSLHAALKKELGANYDKLKFPKFMEL